jgi:hypothetical protein
VIAPRQAVFGFFVVAPCAQFAFSDFFSLYRALSSSFWIFSRCTVRDFHVFGFFFVVQNAVSSFSNFFPLHGSALPCFWIFSCCTARTFMFLDFLDVRANTQRHSVSDGYR